ncbi:hypothetical protein ABFA07_008276 [Porites harrisoni]
MLQLKGVLFPERPRYWWMELRCRQNTADDQLATFLNGLPNNVIVLAATQDEAWWTGGASESNKQVADAQLTNFGATNPRPLGYRATWAFSWL